MSLSIHFILGLQLQPGKLLRRKTRREENFETLWIMSLWKLDGLEWRLGQCLQPQDLLPVLKISSGQSLDVTLCLGILCASLAILYLNFYALVASSDKAARCWGAAISYHYFRSCHKHRRCIPAKEVWCHGWPNSSLGCG